MKKVFAFMMALALMLSLSVTASAEGTGTITITNAIKDETYTLYKIFEADINGDEIFYKVTKDSALEAEMFGEEDSEGFDYFNYDSTSGAVALKAGISDADLFAYLERLTKNEDLNLKYTESAPATTTEVKFENVPYGYYLIAPTNGSLVTVDSTNPDAEVIDKNQTTSQFDKKIWDADVDNGEDEEKGAWVDANSANVGDTVNFKVDFTAVNYKSTTVDGKEVAEKITKYTITDTLNPTDWAKLNLGDTDIVIKVGEKTLTKGTDWTLVESSDSSFKIDIPWVNADGEFLYDPSVKVEITYSATVLEGATENDGSAENKNTAELTWNDETDGDDDETTTKVYNMGFTKVDGEGNALAGAKFGLYTDAACTTPVKVTEVSTGVYMFDDEGSSEFVTSTDAAGQIVIMGLKAGTYYLKELAAPEGYNTMADIKTIVVGAVEKDDEGNDTDTAITSTLKIGETTYTADNAAETVVNNKGVELPSTGGEGTMKMITIGSIVALAFAILLITNKKMTAYQD